MTTRVKTPKQAIYKAAEVCAIAGLQPYVLRSWESEFPHLGVEPPNGKSKVYRQADLDTVLQIKELIITDGLTLGAARRALLKEAPAETEADTRSFEAVLSGETRARVDEIKAGLRSILALLEGSGAVATHEDSPDAARGAGPTAE